MVKLLENVQFFSGWRILNLENDKNQIPSKWQLFISQVRLIKTYGHEGMRATFVLIGLCIDTR